MVSVYKLPTFNLMLNYWNSFISVIPPTIPPTLTVKCQLRMSRAAAVAGVAGSSSGPGPIMFINVPPFTPIQGGMGLGSHVSTLIECPAGTGRYYRVLWVDDVAKGFNNEYRVCCVFANKAPNPIP